MIVAYLRSAKGAESQLSAQKLAMEKAYGPVDRIYKDDGAGVKMRPGLQDAIESLAVGDVLAVERVDRVSRSIELCREVIADVQERGASVISVE